ncbi:MAG: hypothetical protein ABSE64_16635 [Vulcanimicrobiaceae bacterium]
MRNPDPCCAGVVVFDMTLLNTSAKHITGLKLKCKLLDDQGTITFQTTLSAHPARWPDTIGFEDFKFPIDPGDRVHLWFFNYNSEELQFEKLLATAPSVKCDPLVYY